MSQHTADAAIRHLERLLAREPLLRDLVQPVLPMPRRDPRFSPDVDVIEDDRGWVLRLDVPGIAREALSVQLDGAHLIVSGERPARGGGRIRVQERATGAFTRKFLVPFAVDPSQIRAHLSQGVLTLTLPRQGGQRGAQTIEVEGG